MLSETLSQDLKQAQLARDETKVSTLRLLISEIKNSAINKQSLPSAEGKGVELSDDDILSIIQKEVKKRNESIASFQAGGRQDLVLKEEAEMKILKGYLPQQLADADLLQIVEEAIAATGAVSIKDMGKVIGVVMGKVKGRADGNTVSSMVKERLSK